jgi:hypothetical protein
MDQVLQDAQTCQTTEERCLLINTHLNRYVAYSGEKRKTWPSDMHSNRNNILRRDTLDCVPMHEGSDNESSGSSSYSSTHMVEMAIPSDHQPSVFIVDGEEDDSLRHCGDVPPRKRVRFSEDIEMDECVFSDDAHVSAS